MVVRTRTLHPPLEVKAATVETRLFGGLMDSDGIQNEISVYVEVRGVKRLLGGYLSRIRSISLRSSI